MKILSYSILFSGLMSMSISHAWADESSPVIIMDSDPGLLKRKSIVIVKKRSTENEKKGIPLGNFTFLPGFMITEYHDDNVYATESATKSDFVTVFTPTFSLKSNWKKHAINMDGGIEVARFSELTTENTEDIWLNLNGKYDITKEQYLRAGYSYSRDHEDRGSADAAIGNSPVKFDDVSAHIGYSINRNNNHFKIIYNSKKLDFYSVDSTGGPIQNDDRDRHEYGIGLRYLFRYSTNTAFYVDGVSDNRDYDLTPDYEGNNRNSQGYRYSIGIEHVTPTSFGRFYIGQLNRNYKSSIFESINEPDVGLKFSWKFNPKSNLVLETKRSIEETTLNNSPGYLMDDYSLNLSIDLTDKNNLNFNATNAKTTYYVTQREDDYLNFSIGYSLKMQDNLTFSFDLHRANRDSNDSGQNYQINQVFLRIKAAI